MAVVPFAKGLSMPYFMLSLESNHSAADLKAINDSIIEYNDAQVGNHWKGRLTVFAHDDTGQLIGGIIGFTDRGWLRIELLGVFAGWRHQGVGSQLLVAAEQEAQARECHSAWLDTFSFQAQPFYQKHGYSVFGQLEHYPNEHTRYFVRKTLTPS